MLIWLIFLNTNKIKRTNIKTLDPDFWFKSFDERVVCNNNFKNEDFVKESSDNDELFKDFTSNNSTKYECKNIIFSKFQPKIKLAERLML